MPQLKDGIDFVTGNVLSFQQMNRIKNNWYSGATPPDNPVSGMVWVKNDGIVYVYFGAAWVTLPIDHGDLTGVTSDQHHAQLHAASHADSQADELSHDALKDYAANQHRVWEDSIAQDIHNDNISEGSVTQHVGAIDHDALLNTHANPYKLDDLAAPDDNTDLDFSTAKHGLVPKGTDVGNFLKDDGTWAAAGGGAGDVTAAAVLVDHSIIRGDGGAKGIQDSGIIIDDADNVTGMVTLTLPNEGLHILDTNASHDLIIKAGSDLDADYILSLITGNAARTITLSGNPTLADWFDQAIKIASSPTHAALTLSAIAHAGADYDKILVSNSGLISYRTGVEIRGDIGAGTSSLVLGALITQAYRGDRGTLAYNHSQIAGGNSVHVSVAENTAWDAASAHVSATGASHSYINQNVTTTGTPSFNEIYCAVGAAADPSYTFTGDTNTGMYQGGGDIISFACGGVMRMQIRANYVNIKPSTDSYGILIYDSGSSTYFNLKNVNGTCYLCDSTGTSASNFLSGNGTAAYANDHGTAATDQLVNVCYGTGAAPAANTTTIGSLYVKYTA